MTEFPPQPLADILRNTPGLENAFLVGGCVRDRLSGIPVKDFDIEVYGIDYERLVAVLSKHGRADLVGRSFGVVKLSHPSGEVWDFSLPRRDSKQGIGHRGFSVEFDPGISTRDAASRRDFTINSLMWDPRQGRLIDHFGGEADLADRVLRHTSDAFVEDPLRVLRGMQFAGRFRLTAAPETLELCRSISGTFTELPVERVREEWFKWATRSVEPSRGLVFLQKSGWLAHFPELANLIGVPQEPEWHPEGDAWIHTCHCVDALMQGEPWKGMDGPERLVLGLAVLLHDTGKPTCTTREMKAGVERIVSPGHEAAGGAFAERFLQRIGCPAAIAARVVPLVVNHMIRTEAPSPRMIRRLATRLHPATIRELAGVMTADASGRPPLPRRTPESVRAIVAAAEDLKLVADVPKALLLGRHLLERGYSPGPALGEVLKRAYEAQLDGDFTDLEGALEWLVKNGG